MTALNVLVSRNRVDVATDCSVVNPWTSRLATVLFKVHPFPHLNCVLAARGNAVLLINLQRFVSQVKTAEELREKLPNHVRKSPSLLARLFPALYRFDIVVAGHDGKKPYAYVVCSDDTLAPAFEVTDIDFAVVGPRVEGYQQILEEVGDNPRGMDARVEAAMNKIFDLQRPIGGVGVYGQLTTINNFCIYTRLIRRWPDEIGDVLDRKG